MFAQTVRIQIHRRLFAFGLALAASTSMPLAMADTVSTNSGNYLQVSTDAASTPDSLDSLRAKLLEVQKQAYERELELKQLKEQLKSQPNAEPTSPWVQQVNTTGLQNNNGDQPAVNKPDSLKTSIQFYKHQYLLKPGDKLAINFLGEDPNRVTNKEITQSDVNGTYLQNISILTDGTIVLPPFGIIQAAGKTLKQLNDELNTEIGKYYRFAVVTVTLAEAAQDQVVVLGKVKKQGTFKVPVGTTLSQLFKEVDGLEENADVQHVFVRKAESGSVYMLNVEDFYLRGDTGQDIILQTGDVVVIPEGQNLIAYDKYENTPLLIKEFPVRVLGAVQKEDTIMIKPGEDVIAALSKANGLADYARKNKIHLIRLDHETRALKKLTFRMKDLVNPETSAQYNLTMRPNDVILVDDPKWPRIKHTLLTQSLLNSTSFFTAQSLFHILFSKDKR